MPGFDKTGPRGMGSMTGWGRGNCVPNDSTQPEGEKTDMTETGAAGVPVTAPAGFYGLGRGGMPCGCGRGFGGGRGRRFAVSGRGFGGGGRGRGRF
jgi:hypothetical protein